MDLSGRIALVTGADKHLGRSIALALARAGTDIAVHYSRSKAAAQETVAQVSAVMRRAELVSADLAGLSGLLCVEGRPAGPDQERGQDAGRAEHLCERRGVARPTGAQ